MTGNDPRRLLDRGKGRGLLGSDRDDSPAGKFDPAEFNMPPDPRPSAAGRARGAADAAQVHSFFSHLDTNIQRVLAGFGTIRDLVADVRASLADAAARDAERAEDEEARDRAIAARLVDPAVLEARAVNVNIPQKWRTPRRPKFATAANISMKMTSKDTMPTSVGLEARAR